MQKIIAKRTWNRNYLFISNIVRNLTTHDVDMAKIGYLLITSHYYRGTIDNE